jgi:serine/threonine protein kinase
VIRASQERTKFKTDKGPIKWMAPESIKGLEFSLATDIWAFGITLYEIWTDGSDPYPELTTRQVLLKMLSEQNFKLCPTESVPKAIQNIIGDCLQWEQGTRPSAQVLVKTLEQLQKSSDWDSN